MTVEHLQTDTLYPVADQAHLPRRWPAYRTRAKWTGERRAPKAGDWFLSGAKIEAYQASNDLTTAYPIAELVRMNARNSKGI